MLSKSDIEKYFIAEKQESLVFLIIGIAAILMALILHFMVRTQVCRGLAVPLMVLGLMQTIAGYSVYVKSDDHRISQVYAYDMNPDQLKTTELTRMRKVETNFVLYRWIEIGLFASGIILIIWFRESAGKIFWLGFGISLTIMAAELFIADFIAGKRAFFYTSQLEKFNKKV
jgi:hypothetical protein